MKFLFIAPRFHTNQYGAIKGLVAQGHQVEFLARKSGRNECYDQITPIFSEKTFLSRIKQINIILKTYEPDIIIIRGVTLENLAYSCISKIYTKKIILYTQDPLYSSNRNYSRAFARKIMWNTISRVRITPVIGEVNENSFSLPHEHFIPFVVEPPSLSNERKYFPDGHIRILCIGKLSLERKNHILLLKALKDLRTNHPLKLCLLGSLSSEDNPQYVKIKDFINQNKLGDTVTIRPNIPYNSCQKEYINHDLFILPSRNEPATVSHLEAMSYGLPVICSDTNGTKSYIEEGKNGFIFHSDNLKDLKDKIIRIISNRDTLMKMGRESLTIVKEKYLPQRWHDKILKIIEQEFS